MRLPNGNLAAIDPRKIRDYLLSPEHPVGRFKAAWFKGVGFTGENWRSLQVELSRIADEGEAETGDRTAYGQKYVVRGRIRGPAGRTGAILSVWMVLHGEKVPRFVTAYPEERQ